MGFQEVSTEFSGRVIFVGVDVGPYTGLGTHDDAVRLYKVQEMPTTLFLTATGQVTDHVTGIMTEDQLRSRIQQKLLGAA